MAGELTKGPSQGAEDIAQVVAKAAVSAIPFAGGPAAELFALIFRPSLERRRDEWITAIASAVEELQERVEGITPESLAQDESFITVALHASQIALRNHQTEKLAALRNAVQNSALSSAPEDDLKLMFVDLVDTLTPWHLRILKLVSDPPAWFAERGIPWPALMMGGFSSVLEAAFPELRGRRDFYTLLGRDLYTRGLTGIDGFSGLVSGPGLRERRTTAFGAQFLGFIERQVENST